MFPKVLVRHFDQISAFQHKVSTGRLVCSIQKVVHPKSNKDFEPFVAVETVLDSLCPPSAPPDFFYKQPHRTVVLYKRPDTIIPGVEKSRSCGELSARNLEVSAIKLFLWLRHQCDRQHRPKT